MKPTDFFGKELIYDKMGQMIWGVQRDGRHQKICDIRGWGTIQYLFKDKKGVPDLDRAAKFQDEIGEWMLEAMKEKMKRELTNPH